MPEESIYNLAQPEENFYDNSKVTRNLRKNKKPPVLPTGSTFINSTTFRPGVANLGGDNTLLQESHSYKGSHSTFGKKPGDYRPDTKKFLLKNTGKSGCNELPPISTFKYSEKNKPALDCFADIFQVVGIFQLHKESNVLVEKV